MDVSPTLRPIFFITCAIIRTVVVLPLEPVTATIGMREGVPTGNSMSITGRATYCGSPSVGCVCIRKPGAAFTSTIAPPVSRTGRVMSGVMKSMPATSSPTTRAASSAMSTLSSCASHVRSIALPPVDMLPVDASSTIALDSGTSSRSSPCDRTSASAASSTRMRVSTFSWPMPRLGFSFSIWTSWRTVWVPSPTTWAGTRSATATILPSTTSSR